MDSDQTLIFRTPGVPMRLNTMQNDWYNSNNYLLGHLRRFRKLPVRKTKSMLKQKLPALLPPSFNQPPAFSNQYLPPLSITLLAHVPLFIFKQMCSKGGTPFWALNGLLLKGVCKGRVEKGSSHKGYTTIKMERIIKGIKKVKNEICK